MHHRTRALQADNLDCQVLTGRAGTETGTGEQLNGLSGGERQDAFEEFTWYSMIGKLDSM